MLLRRGQRGVVSQLILSNLRRTTTTVTSNGSATSMRYRGSSSGVANLGLLASVRCCSSTRSCTPPGGEGDAALFGEGRELGDGSSLGRDAASHGPTRTTSFPTTASEARELLRTTFVSFVDSRDASIQRRLKALFDNYSAGGATASSAGTSASTGDAKSDSGVFFGFPQELYVAGLASVASFTEGKKMLDDMVRLTGIAPSTPHYSAFMSALLLCEDYQNKEMALHVFALARRDNAVDAALWRELFIAAVEIEMSAAQFDLWWDLCEKECVKASAGDGDIPAEGANATVDPLAAEGAMKWCGVNRDVDRALRVWASIASEDVAASVSLQTYADLVAALPFRSKDGGVKQMVTARLRQYTTPERLAAASWEAVGKVSGALSVESAIQLMATKAKLGSGSRMNSDGVGSLPLGAWALLLSRLAKEPLVDEAENLFSSLAARYGWLGPKDVAPPSPGSSGGPMLHRLVEADEDEAGCILSMLRMYSILRDVNGAISFYVTWVLRRNVKPRPDFFRSLFEAIPNSVEERRNVAGLLYKEACVLGLPSADVSFYADLFASTHRVGNLSEAIGDYSPSELDSMMSVPADAVAADQNTAAPMSGQQ